MNEILDQSTMTELERFEQMKSIVITSSEQCVEVFHMLKSLKSTRQRIVDFFSDPKSKAHAAWKSIVAKEKSFTDRIDAVEKVGKRAIAIWDEAEQKRVEQERIRLQRIADEQARKEREKLQAEEARQRAIADEKRKIAERARKDAEEASGAEREKLLKAATAAENRANTAETKADENADIAQTVIAPVVNIEATEQKIDGKSTRKTWKVKIVNVDLIPREYMVPNEKALDALAKASKGLIKIPGVEFYAETTIGIRR